MRSLKFEHPYLKINLFIDSVVISLNSEHQSLKSFELSVDIYVSHACPIAAKMSLSRHSLRVVNGEHIPCGSNTAETND